jgi:agmatinase
MTFSPDAAARPDSGIFGLDTPASDAGVVLVPVPFDATTSYGRRAAKGPAAILEASHQVDLYDRETGRPYEAGIAFLPESELVRRANSEARVLADQARRANGPARAAACAKVNALSEQVNDWVYAEANRWLEEGRLVGVVGGDHATPFGLIRAVVERFPKVGILHVDAHADLRDAYEGFAHSHASIMNNVVRQTKVTKLVQVGIRDFAESELRMIEGSGGRIVTYFDADLSRALLGGKSFQALAKAIVTKLPREVYVSFDIDGLDPTLCPNTGTPVPGGLSFQQASLLLSTLVAAGRRIVGFDLNEVAPGDDGGEWDANVGARLLYKMCGFALKSRSKRRAARSKG